MSTKNSKTEKAEPTPGDWRLDLEGHSIAVVTGEGDSGPSDSIGPAPTAGTYIATFDYGASRHGYHVPTRETAIANANLAAAARDLLAACEGALEWLATEEPEEAADLLREAVRKARP